MLPRTCPECGRTWAYEARQGVAVSLFVLCLDCVVPPPGRLEIELLERELDTRRLCAVGSPIGTVESGVIDQAQDAGRMTMGWQ